MFVPITTTELAIRSGAVWAHEILSTSIGNEPSIPDERPWALCLLLQPALGHADGACVVRVSQTVVVSGGIAVVRTIETFEADGC